MKINGFNHVTLIVGNLSASLQFYEKVLGLKRIHLGNTDAYLLWGSAWICLMERKDTLAKGEHVRGVDHIAFSIAEDDFDEAVEKLKQANVSIVRGPIQRGGGKVINFLDPDEIQLELNTSDLETRMKDWK
ncbi:VOC family protein [Alkalihalobacillus sp. AL-G]|uniref:VOC family protein n=1 Tax=Alkalihalobacillus sp. AL-G TaxID=2926399 RepID=UPI00272B7ED0|nr:VOC family protein [Alkalihalobacillus sp. AL-G]WLD94021.1 VOC family protein [Alkalihalobacillus sp. AL-G]